MGTPARHLAPAGLVALVAIVTALGIAACSDDDPAPAGDASAAGAALYERACASCHGSDLRGTPMGPPHLSQVYAPDHHSDESFRRAITEGSPAHHWTFGDMPAVPGLDDEEIDQIIAFVREQQELHGLEPYPPE